jgi:hypothetical protein
MPPPPTAAAPRLLTPVRLPRRLDGQRIDHLSASSLARFWRCPEAWRAHYLARVRGPESAELRRGWVVDAAIEAHFKALLATGEPLPQRDVEDIYAAAWQRKIDDPAIEIDWGDDSPAHVKDSGLIALRAYLTELAPAVRPASVQREFSFALAPDLEWTLTGRLDLEDADGDVIDIKVKKRHVAQADADSDPQPSLYLLERALAGRPARRFVYHSVNPTAKQAKTKIVPTARTRAQLQVFVARVLATARAIDGLYRQFGPEGPWPLADPTHWCCSPRFCAAWARCPGGGGPIAMPADR